MRSSLLFLLIAAWLAVCFARSLYQLSPALTDPLTSVFTPPRLRSTLEDGKSSTIARRWVGPEASDEDCNHYFQKGHNLLYKPVADYGAEGLSDDIRHPLSPSARSLCQGDIKYKTVALQTFKIHLTPW